MPSWQTHAVPSLLGVDSPSHFEHAAAPSLAATCDPSCRDAEIGATMNVLMMRHTDATANASHLVLLAEETARRLLVGELPLGAGAAEGLPWGRDGHNVSNMDVSAKNTHTLHANKHIR